ncbi:MAG: transporter [Lutispora sp.]|nr:transporter [Lutispora sp.]
MSKMFILAKVLLKTNFKLTKKSIDLGLIIVLSLLPMTGLIWTAAWEGYDIMAGVGQQGLILWTAISLVSLLTFLLGIFFIMGVFFYSNDIELLIPLPLKPWQILGAKFITVLVYEYMSQLVLFAPVLLAYGIKDNASFVYYVYGLLVYLLLPIVPLVFSSFINILVMRSFRFVKNKDKMKTISGIVTMAMAIGFNIVVQRFSRNLGNPEELVGLIQQGNNSLLLKSQDVFIVNRFMAMALTNYGDLLSSLGNIVLSIIGVAAFIGLFLYTGEKLYLKGVIGLTEAAPSRKPSGNATKRNFFKGSSALGALRGKELKLLFRTPVYFLNCILMNFLWPVFLLIPIFTGGEEMGQISELSKYLGDPKVLAYIVAGAAGTALFISGSNMISSTSISREGKNLYVSKYLPVDYKTQINAKAQCGMLMGLTGMIMALIVAWIVLSFPLYLLMMAMLVSLPCIFFINYVGVLIDLKFPKLNWDNEQKAVKQNMNGLLAMLISAGFGALNFGLVIYLRLNYISAFATIICFYILADLLLYKLASGYGAKLFGEL